MYWSYFFKVVGLQEYFEVLLPAASSDISLGLTSYNYFQTTQWLVPSHVLIF